MRRTLLSFLVCTVQLLILALPCVAAVGVDSANCNSGSKQYISSTTSPQATGSVYSVTTGFPTMLVILEIDSTTVPTISSVVWDASGANVTLTLIGSQTAASGPIYLYGATSGIVATTSKAITITTSANTQKLFVAMCTFSGTATPVASAFTHFTSGTGVATVSVTNASGDIIAGGHSSAVPLGTPTGTQIFIDQSSGSVENAAANYASGTGSPVAIGSSSAAQSLAYVDVVASGGGGAVPTGELMLMGVGP